MPDFDWRSSFRDSALLWLHSQGESIVYSALRRSQLVGMEWLDDEHLGLKLIVQSDSDRETLAHATQSWTDSEMPGLLDMAFERAIPGGLWPVFAFDIAGEGSSSSHAA